MNSKYKHIKTGPMVGSKKFFSSVKEKEFEKAAQEDNFTGFIIMHNQDDNEIEIRESIDGKLQKEKKSLNKKRRETNSEVELKKVTMKIDKEIHNQFSDHVRNNLKSNVTAEIEKYMKKEINEYKEIQKAVAYSLHEYEKNNK